MSEIKSDIQIAREAKMQPINDVLDKINVPDESTAFSPMGRHIAKINLEYLNTLKDKPDGKLILVTAITPTPAGEGKTTTSVGLNDGLNKIGKKSIVCLREPSLGPSFGMKGGAAGGGYAQVVPMEQINLHFTGDFHAITSAHNLLSALIDNHIYWGNKLDIDVRRIVWKRVIDMNDRSLRSINSKPKSSRARIRVNTKPKGTTEAAKALSTKSSKSVLLRLVNRGKTVLHRNDRVRVMAEPISSFAKKSVRSIAHTGDTA